MTRRWRIRAYGACVALLVIGGACALLVDGLTGQVLMIAFEMAGLGGALLLVFFEVGVSEDQAREREERRQRRRR